MHLSKKFTEQIDAEAQNSNFEASYLQNRLICNNKIYLIGNIFLKPNFFVQGGSKMF